jgi:hypothetical protein
MQVLPGGGCLMVVCPTTRIRWRSASMVASAGRTDRDLAAPQFHKSSGAYNNIAFQTILNKFFIIFIIFYSIL